MAVVMTRIAQTKSRSPSAQNDAYALPGAWENGDPALGARVVLRKT